MWKNRTGEFNRTSFVDIFMLSLNRASRIWVEWSKDELIRFHTNVVNEDWILLYIYWHNRVSTMIINRQTLYIYSRPSNSWRRLFRIDNQSKIRYEPLPISILVDQKSIQNIERMRLRRSFVPCMSEMKVKKNRIAKMIICTFNLICKRSNPYHSNFFFRLFFGYRSWIMLGIDTCSFPSSQPKRIKLTIRSASNTMIIVGEVKSAKIESDRERERERFSTSTM